MKSIVAEGSKQDVTNVVVFVTMGEKKHGDVHTPYTIHASSII